MTWLRENFARVQSLNLPVTLHRYIPRGYIPWANNKVELDLIDEHMSHIRELVILVNPASMVCAMPLTNAAPLLESLILSQYGLRVDDMDDSMVDCLSDNIFAGHVPALRRLVLRGYIFNWTTSSLISASITHFELSLPGCALIQHPDEDGPDSLQQPSRAQLFLCLQRMPMLEALKLENCWPITSEDPWPNTILEFTHLRRLELTGTMARCVGFLKRVRMPSSASLHMSLYIDKREISDDYGALIDIVAAQINVLSAGRRVSAAAFQLSAKDSTNGYAAGLKLWRSQIGTALAKEEWQPFITVSFDARPSVLPVLRLLTSRLHLPELQVLSFFCKFERTHARIEAIGNTMMELFAKFAGVKHLIMNMRAADVLGHAMSITDSHVPSGTGPAEDTAVSRLFRELTAISLRDTYCCFGSSKAHATLRGFASKYFEGFRRSLVALVQDPGHLQLLNVSWQDLDEWRSLFEGVVCVQPLPAAIERYMDLEATTQLLVPQSVVEIQTPFGLEFDAEE
ncbi:hypothetical protein EWM64_g8484 [Hericium alpestre]|uniref:F-box domain-containing protein n=1 Tax=Hericium alpestre TaxID=135208 RepID=A0A4Y9ZPV9_9AGAM|nr:hypothetical protein EWM64_g8484 [Hericium alpestre]